MSERDFLSPSARESTRRAVVDAEAETSAELVVAVRRVSGRYRDADYLCGFGVSLLALLALLFLPREFALWAFVPDVALSFALGALVCPRLPALRRALTPARVLDENARVTACAAFLDGDLSRLPDRNAILVYVALFERRVVVLPDRRIDTAALGEEWLAALRALDATLRPRPDLVGFQQALRALGRLLGSVHPRAADDVNELPDEVMAG